MKWDQIASILRHILTFGGGFAVAKGWISEQTMVSIVGAIITIGGAIWGVVNKTDSSIAASIGASTSTTVIPGAGGTATVQINDPNMARSALMAQAQARTV